MNKAIKNIGKYFSKFECIEFQIDSRNEKIDFDLNEFEYFLQKESRKFESDLQLFYLDGNDLVLKKVKKELLKIEEECLKLKSNVGVNIRIEESGSKHSIEPGLIDSINEIKLKYSNKLISIINYFLETREEELSKSDKLKEQLSKYGFFELPKVKQLSEPTKQSLIELIAKKDLPYSIAMLDFLDFFKHLEKEYFKTKYKLNREVAKWFDSDKDGRGVKGNISVLSENSNENKSKFTAHLHKETVEIDYQNLK